MLLVQPMLLHAAELNCLKRILHTVIRVRSVLMDLQIFVKLDYKRDPGMSSPSTRWEVM